MINNYQPKRTSLFIFTMSGLFGGLAEIIWMYTYNLNSVIGLKEINNEIVRTLHISSSNHYLGLIIHLTLSVLIGITFGKLIIEKFCKNSLFLVMFSSLIILAGIWACAFKLILPMINPGMVTIVPEPISFISKMLFGIIMALSYTIFNSVKR